MGSGGYGSTVLVELLLLLKVVWKWMRVLLSGQTGVDHGGVGEGLLF